MEDEVVSGSDGDSENNTRTRREWVPLILPGCGGAPGVVACMTQTVWKLMDGWMDVEDDLETGDFASRLV